MTFISYAQNFEDVLLWRALGDLRTGFYIDVGASHPDIDSVTRAFYDRGWRGINIEPTSGAFVRLAAARPRDVNLQLALGRAPGTMPFSVVEGPENGLSTLDCAAASRLQELGFASREMEIEVDTLASVCRQHAAAEINFLKVDVEGAERSVLEGADFARFRPWILLVEATAPMSTRETHGDWENLLLEVDYRFVWFDGLNRFYVAAEHFARLSPKFSTPPNVFDNFLRAADTEWARRLSQAEADASAALSRAIAAETRIAIGQDRAETALLRLAQVSAQGARARAEAEYHREQADQLRRAIDHADGGAPGLRERVERAEQGRAAAEAWLQAMRQSTSWRLTGPLRRALRALRSGRESPAAREDPPSELPPPKLKPPVAPPQTAPMSIRAVHQFHSGTATGDAITNAMLLTRALLRQLGYDSHIFAQYRAPGLEAEVHGLDALSSRADYALIVRHSMGHDALDYILALPAPKILLYHNITPPELLDDTPVLQNYALKGRQQLEQLRPAVVAALADSEFNALELRRAGFGAVAICPLLFDIDCLLARSTRSRRSPVFTVLFVGRLARSKGQAELVQAFARFLELYRGPARLVLVGRNNEDVYATQLFALVRRLKLADGHVEITGLVSDEELEQRYAAADLYVSLSQHEGFGVPLIEAMAHDVPVLAWPSGAVPYTLGGEAALLDDREPALVAVKMLELADDPQARDVMARRQRHSLERWRLDRHLPTLVSALGRAGVTAPLTVAATKAALGDNMRFTVAGHVNGTYSLAELNRSLALQLEASRPGAVRLLAVEGDVTTDIEQIPAEQRSSVVALATRSQPPTGPHVVISQHYPVWVPAERGDLTLAYFFWEESLVPAETVERLNADFDGVLAPSCVVAKALIDSGVCVPVRVVGAAISLSGFYKLRDERRSIRPSGPFVFLHVSSGFPRKGVDVLLAAYCAAFRQADPVVLVVKTFPNPHNTVVQLLETLRVTDPDAPTIELVDQDLPESALLDLYRRADAMVLPSRGEGLNLPAAEALAAGLTLIVTGHGGHIDFLGDAATEGVRLVAYTFSAAGTHLSTPFSLWAEPDRADLATSLREAVRTPRQPSSNFIYDSAGMVERLTCAATELLLRPRPSESAIAFVTTWDVACGIAGYARHLIENLPGVTTILADQRTAAAQEGGRHIVPAWEIGDDQDFANLATALIRFNPGVVVLQHQPGLIPWRNLAPLIGLPALHGRVVCIVLHNTQHLLDVDAPQRRSAVMALQRASRVVVHTIPDVNRLAMLGLERNVTLIPHGVPEGADCPALAESALSPDQPVLIGCYGFFLPDKGILQLVEALPLIRERYKRARLRLVNALYPVPLSTIEAAAARRLTAALGLDDAVEFVTDFLPEYRSTELLAECDLIVMPYQRSTEASSAALRSAMQAGKVVAVTALSLFDEAEDAVFRLPGKLPSDLAAGVLALLADPQGRQSIVNNARRWRKRREWSSVAHRWRGMLLGLERSGIVVGQDDGPDPVR